jgi:uncharacterized membrane protein
MESLLHDIAGYVALAIQAIAILVVAAGSARALVHLIRLTFGPPTADVEKRSVWLEYARWLVAGLTFQLAADIVNTSVSATWNEVGRLAAVAAIRTFLSYFLDREMEHTSGLQRSGALPDARAETLHGDSRRST